MQFFSKVWLDVCWSGYQVQFNLRKCYTFVGFSLIAGALTGKISMALLLVKTLIVQCFVIQTIVDFHFLRHRQFAWTAYCRCGPINELSRGAKISFINTEVNIMLPAGKLDKEMQSDLATIDQVIDFLARWNDFRRGIIRKGYFSSTSKRVRM